MNNEAALYFDIIRCRWENQMMQEIHLVGGYYIFDAIIILSLILYIF